MSKNESKNESKEESKEEKKNAVYPDQLNITINTSIPGYQKIQYKPSMTIKDIDERIVHFNPLIKLNKSLVDKIPKEYRIKEFFNSGLFQSLLNYMGEIPLTNLVTATRNGYVDNNIKVTLDTIFPIGSVIYIGGKPYTIGDIQWSRGDWSMDVKYKKMEIDLSKIRDRYLYNQLVREEIISEVEQLRQLPKSILTGNNYAGPQPLAQGPPQPLAQGPAPAVDQGAAPLPELSAAKPETVLVPYVPKKSKEPSSTALVPSSVPQPKPVKQIEVPQPPPISMKQIEQSKPLPQIESTQPPPIPMKQIQAPPEEKILFDDFKQGLKINKASTNEFINYFKNTKYRYMVKVIIHSLAPDIGDAIRDFYYAKTDYTPAKRSNTIGVSNMTYDRLCEQVSILESPGDGDCFFDALAKGINIYNYENQNSKITYANIYGTKQLFTIYSLREIVSANLQNDLMDLDKYKEFEVYAKYNAKELNRIFSETLDNIKKSGIQQLTDEVYMETLNEIYIHNDNFLVLKPIQKPTVPEEIENPFHSILEGSELGPNSEELLNVNNYIKSKNYWANEYAITSVCAELKIRVIPIERYEHEVTKKKGKTIVTEKDALLKTIITYNDCRDKVIYLYHTSNHYELIRFNYKIIDKQITNEFRKKQIIYEDKYFTIFKTNEMGPPDYIFPPFHVLLLIYGANYSSTDDASKENFGIYKIIMKQMHKSVISILGNNEFSKNFVIIFNYYFPQNMRITNLSLTQPIEEQSLVKLKGGEPFPNNSPNPYPNNNLNYNPYTIYNQYPSYNPNYNQSIPTKQTNPSKILYSITIDMELHPGTSLTPEQISQSKCNNRYNAVRKAFAEFTGRPYILPPVYPQINNNTRKSEEPIKKGGTNKTRKNRN